jgi:hypothetical protein
MIVTELLEEARSKEIFIMVDGDNIRCQGPESSLTPELIEGLREYKADILSLMLCGQCGTPLGGPVHKLWRVLYDGGASYLCSPLCVHQAYPWKEEVSHDYRR